MILKEHFRTAFNFDIRVSGNARFMDQKVTPDVLFIVSDCLLNYLNKEGRGRKVFQSRDIWDSSYAKENVAAVFAKTEIINKNAANEYDKFFHQPLKALAYSRVLEEEKIGNKVFFSVNNHPILEFIASKEGNAIEFLYLYLLKVLDDSSLIAKFTEFFNYQNPQNFSSLKKTFEDFIIKHTNINGEVEARRIFPKILNLLAYKKQSRGTEKGRLSRDVITRDDIYYNRRNFRDSQKKKNETRSEFTDRTIGYTPFVSYRQNKAIAQIRDIHNGVSEVRDEESKYTATQVHHIFMKSEFPELAGTLENLILLTPNQHFLQAHPKNLTYQIDLQYQYICLKSKIASIREHPEFYDKNTFIEMLNEGLRFREAIPQDSSFDFILAKLSQHYAEFSSP